MNKEQGVKVSMKHYVSDDGAALIIEYSFLHGIESILFRVTNFELLDEIEFSKFLKMFEEFLPYIGPDTFVQTYDINLSEEILPLVRILVDTPAELEMGKLVLLFAIVEKEISPDHGLYLKTLIHNQVPMTSNQVLLSSSSERYLSPFYSIEDLLHQGSVFIPYEISSALIDFLIADEGEVWGDFIGIEPKFKILPSQFELQYSFVDTVAVSKYVDFNNEFLKKLSKVNFYRAIIETPYFLSSLYNIIFKRMYESEVVNDLSEWDDIDQDYPFNREKGEKQFYEDNYPNKLKPDHFFYWRQIYAHLLVEHGLEAARELLAFGDYSFFETHSFNNKLHNEIINYYDSCDWTIYSSTRLGMLAEGFDFIGMHPKF